ncbi:hypothetical protein XELAEV_18035570mg [Xenopus laevis]|uniref:Uncharacterized protein n=1 Tax=Xenopus laevis TaxID=8355 RepID=A0A974HC76_XENLA|nr:hypothetical protein XELAEV_18035570mg [Xenopus laevis]
MTPACSCVPRQLSVPVLAPLQLPFPMPVPHLAAPVKDYLPAVLLPALVPAVLSPATDSAGLSATANVPALGSPPKFPCQYAALGSLTKVPCHCFCFRLPIHY